MCWKKCAPGKASTSDDGSAGAMSPSPASAASIVAASATLDVNVPMLSICRDSGKMPSCGQCPVVALQPTTPHSAAGQRTDPPVSVPNVNAASPAAIATADPWLDPPVILATSVSHGFHGGGVSRLKPPSANSVVAVLPRITHPLRLSRVTNPPCGSTRSPMSTLLPAVVGMPSTL